MRGERVLVTGGAGFTGSNLAQALAEENDVVILDESIINQQILLQLDEHF